MTDISNRTETWRDMPPEPEWDGKHWYYRNAKYFKAEAFREYNDDRAQALQERIATLMKYAEHPRSCTNYGDPNECTCGLTAIMERLRKEGLA